MPLFSVLPTPPPLSSQLRDQVSVDSRVMPCDRFFCVFTTIESYLALL